MGLADHILTPLSIPVAINLTGGEPLLVPGIMDFLTYLGSAFPHVDELNIITNATVVSDSMIQSLSTLPRLSAIKVSLESDRPEINNAIRGAGHFENVLHNIARLQTIGRPIILMVTLGSHNVSTIRGLCELARRISVSGIIFERYVPLGQGTNLASQVLTAHQWAQASMDICCEADMEVEAEDLLPYKAFWFDTSSAGDPSRDRVSGAMCNLGPSSMALMPDGTVYPCRRLPIPVGHLPSQTIHEIRSRLEEFSPENLVSKMRGDRCGTCGIEGCIGCRALTRATCGDLFADDRQCGKAKGEE